jgi:uncharacterized LabA/DUF88 family protein
MDRGRTIVFIDNSNVFSGQLSAGWRLDARKFKEYLERSGKLWQVFFFASVTDPPRYQQTGFYNTLRYDLRWEVELFPLGRRTTKCANCGVVKQVFAEKGVDVAVATKMLTLAHNRAFDTAILVSGDKDYLQTVRSVKSLGLRVEIVSWRASLSRDLAVESSGPVIFLEDIRAEIERVAPIDPEVETLTTGEAVIAPMPTS